MSQLAVCDCVIIHQHNQIVVPDGGGATSHTITALDPGNACTVKVIAVFGSTSSESD